jgi:tetratricopeptide (TPR) repeat protein
LPEVVVKVSRVIPVCLSAALPGCGHIAAGQAGKGILVFFLFGFALDGWLYSQAQSILPAESTTPALAFVRYGAIALGVILWVFAVADTAALALRRRRIETMADAANAHIGDALVAYLRNDYDAAVKALRAALRVNDQDIDALFHLGVVYAATGQRRKARRALYRCIRYDHDGKWDNEAQEQLRALESTPPSSPPPAEDGGLAV